MRKDAYLKHLSDVSLFRACNRRELAALARHADEVEIDPDTTLVSQGERGHEFFVIVEGSAQVKRGSRTLATLGPGDFFGELALLDPAPRNATVVAVTPMRLIVLSERDFASVLRSVPSVSTKLLGGLARRLREVDAKTVH